VEGFDIYKEFAPLSNEKIFDKHVNSAFKESGLTEYLQSKQEKMVIIAGLQTDYCIDATVKAGFDRGYDMIIPAFCNTTDQNEFMTAEQSYHYYNAKMWNQRYGKCVTLEEVFRLIP
jgi:nicotinamidase-related amidase